MMAELLQNFLIQHSTQPNAACEPICHLPDLPPAAFTGQLTASELLTAQPQTPALGGGRADPCGWAVNESLPDGREFG